MVPLGTTRAEVRAARERQAVIVGHTSVFGLPSGVMEMDAAGILGPDQIHVHCNAAEPGVP